MIKKFLAAAVLVLSMASCQTPSKDYVIHIENDGELIEVFGNVNGHMETFNLSHDHPVHVEFTRSTGFEILLTLTNKSEFNDQVRVEVYRNDLKIDDTEIDIRPGAKEIYELKVL